MSSTSIFYCIITIVPNLEILFICSVFICKYFITNTTNVWVFSWVLILFVNNFIFFLFKINYLYWARSLKDSQNFFIQSLPLYTCAYFLCLLMTILQTLENLKEYVHLLLLCMNFKDYFYPHKSFILNIRNMYK